MKHTLTTEEEIDLDLKEIKNYFGDWDSLKKRIGELEEREAEMAWERSQEDYEGRWTAGEEQHRQNEAQKLK